MALGAGIASAGVSLYQAYDGAKRAKEAKEEINEFQRQELINPYENIQVSNKKSNQQTEANLSAMATSVDAAQRGGARSIISTIPRLSENNILLQNMISQDIENQQQQRDLLIAKGEENIRTIRERREEGALQGLGQALQTGRQDMMSGFSNLVSSGLSLAGAYDGAETDVE